MSEPRDSSSHNLCLFVHIPFFVPFLRSPLSFLFVCSLSSVPSVSPPCPHRWPLWKMGRSQRISIYLTPACPSSSPHSLIYHTQVLLIVVWQPAPGARPRARLILSELLSSLPLLRISLHPGFACLQFCIAVKSDSTLKPVFVQILCVI